MDPTATPGSNKTAPDAPHAASQVEVTPASTKATSISMPSEKNNDAPLASQDGTTKESATDDRKKPAVTSKRTGNKGIKLKQGVPFAPIIKEKLAVPVYESLPDEQKGLVRQLANQTLKAAVDERNRRLSALKFSADPKYVPQAARTKLAITCSKDLKDNDDIKKIQESVIMENNKYQQKMTGYLKQVAELEHKHAQEKQNDIFLEATLLLADTLMIQHCVYNETTPEQISRLPTDHAMAGKALLDFIIMNNDENFQHYFTPSTPGDLASHLEEKFLVNTMLPSTLDCTGSTVQHILGIQQKLGELVQLATVPILEGYLAEVKHLETNAHIKAHLKAVRSEKLTKATASAIATIPNVNAEQMKTLFNQWSDERAAKDAQSNKTGNRNPKKTARKKSSGGQDSSAKPQPGTRTSNGNKQNGASKKRKGKNGTQQGPDQTPSSQQQPNKKARTDKTKSKTTKSKTSGKGKRGKGSHGESS